MIFLYIVSNKCSLGERDFMFWKQFLSKTKPEQYLNSGVNELFLI